MRILGFLFLGWTNVFFTSVKLRADGRSHQPDVALIFWDLIRTYDLRPADRKTGTRTDGKDLYKHRTLLGNDEGRY